MQRIWTTENLSFRIVCAPQTKMPHLENVPQNRSKNDGKVQIEQKNTNSFFTGSYSPLHLYVKLVWFLKILVQEKK